MKQLLIAFLLIASFTSFSQDFVVTTKGDSLLGSIKFLSYDLLDRVQVTNTKKVLLTAIQVKLVLLNGETYKAARLGNAIRFMKVIRAGYLSLYGFKVENQSGYDGRMLIKMDGKSIEVPNLAFKKAMIDFLEDCELVTEKIKSGEYGRKDLESIIDTYNACLNEKSKIAAGPPTITDLSKSQLTAIAALKKKTESIKDSKSKDALDLLDDMNAKLSKGESIPNYQIEALKNILANQPEVKPELDNLLAFFRK